MTPIPPSEAIRSSVTIHFSLLGRQTRRDYAGFAVGKRRVLSVVPVIAKELAVKILHDVVLLDTAKPVAPETVANRIEAVLLAFPEADAFRIVSLDSEDATAAPVR